MPAHRAAPAAADPVRGDGTVAATVLALQRAGGNRATCAALGDRRVLARFWVKDNGQYRWEADERKKGLYVATAETRSSWWPWRWSSPVYVPSIALSHELMLGYTHEEVADVENQMLDDLDTMNRTNLGRRLLDRLSAARHRTKLEPSPTPLVAGPVTESPIRPEFDPRDPEKGAPPTVRMQFKAAVNALEMGLEQRDRQPEPAWNPTPSDVALFHELVHAYHQASGTSASGRVSREQAIHAGDENVSMTEYQATGLDARDGSASFSAAEFTENRYRQERGVPLRDSYIPPGWAVPQAAPLL